MMVDELIPDESIYVEWIANRRDAEPPRELIDRIMAAVEARDLNRIGNSTLAHRINKSRFARWAACMAASLVGCLPFLFVAHVANLLVF